MGVVNTSRLSPLRNYWFFSHAPPVSQHDCQPADPIWNGPSIEQKQRPNTDCLATLEPLLNIRNRNQIEIHKRNTECVIWVQCLTDRNVNLTVYTDLALNFCTGSDGCVTGEYATSTYSCVRDIKESGTCVHL